MGLEAEGFATIGYEVSRDAVATYNTNLAGEAFEVRLTTETQLPKAPLVVAGPPCQPFSVVGKQRGEDDGRDCFPIFLSAVDRVEPDIVLFENVKGLLFRNRAYFDSIVRRLRVRGYSVDFEVLNASHYGVPQRRERLVAVAVRRRIKFRFPPPSDIGFVSGDAISRTASRTRRDSRFLTESQDTYIARYEAKSECRKPRDLQLDREARTVTCRNLAAATSDMMRVRLADGRRRRLSVDEAARLQSFPPWFRFRGVESSRFDQIGNAVPPLMAAALARSLSQAMS